MYVEYYFNVTYHQRSRTEGVERVAGGMSPTTASDGCCIDRRTFGSGRPADRIRAWGTDTGEGPIASRWSRTFAVYWADVPSVPSLQLLSANS